MIVYAFALLAIWISLYHPNIVSAPAQITVVPTAFPARNCVRDTCAQTEGTCGHEQAGCTYNLILHDAHEVL